MQIARPVLQYLSTALLYSCGPPAWSVAWSRRGKGTITGVARIDLGPTLINKLREVLSSSSEFIKHLSNKKVSHKFSTVYKLHVSR